MISGETMTKKISEAGRLLDHVHIVVTNIEKSRAFYKAVLASLGKTLTYEAEMEFESDELFVSQRVDSQKLSQLHLAFRASSKEMVKAFYDAALIAGGKDNGSPGKRSYHREYFAAYVLDPDGNNIEAVFHGPIKKSAESVIIQRL